MHHRKKQATSTADPRRIHALLNRPHPGSGATKRVAAHLLASGSRTFR